LVSAIKLNNGINIYAGSFKFAVEAIPDRDGEVDIEFDESYLNFKQKNFHGRALLSDDMHDPPKYRWEGISVPPLCNIARMIPDDALYWHNISLDLKLKIDEYETQVLNIRKPVREVMEDKDLERELYKQDLKEYNQSLKHEWAKRSEYRRLMERLDEARAHLYSLDIFLTDERLEVYINIDGVDGGAEWILPVKRVIEINEQ